LYAGSGETDGPRKISNEEYFRFLAQQIIGMLSKTTRDGFVYRVDARLRPFGDSGPLAFSLPALEAYLARHGRDWERYAYVKARVINDWPGTQSFYKDILRPFIYRRYLDYGVFSSLREMKSLIEAEVAKKEFQDNIKLGRGGIREIEFIVQSLQLVRGGTNEVLQNRELLPSLAQLVRPGGRSAIDKPMMCQQTS
jgi:glutamate-ammonia-ligase adenylyltransferase